MIPAHNEAAWIARSVNAIRRAAEGLEFDLVVVDDSSSDDTGARATAAGARVLRVEHRQISATRNAGAREVRGEWLCFVDADTEINAEVVRASAAALRDGAGGGGAPFRFDDPVPRWARWAERVGGWLCRTCKLTGGCYFFVRRDVFERVGGFDENLFAAEELALAAAIKRQARFVIVGPTVLTSARKLRVYQPRELLRRLWKLLWAGPKALLNRDALDLWYGRREEG